MKTLLPYVIALLLLSTSQLALGQTVEEAAINEIKQLLDTNPAEALSVLEKHWPDQEVNLDHLENGLLKVLVLSKNNETEQALSLLHEYEALSGLDLQQQGLLVARKIEVLRGGKIKEGVSALNQKAESILSNLQEKTAPGTPDKALSWLNQQLGYDFYYQAQFSQAEPYFLTALTHMDPDNVVGRSKLLNTIGVVYAQQANMGQGAKYMLDSIKLLEDHDLTVTPDRYRNLGSLYFLLKDFNKSLAFSQKAADGTPDTVAAKASIFNNMAAAYIELGENDLAIEKMQQAITINMDLGVTTSSVRNNLGYLYNQTGEYEKALEQLNMSASELDDVENAELKGVSFKSRADVYANMGNYQKAVEFYEEAYLRFKETDLKPKRIELYPKMVEALVKIDSFRRAYEMMVEYKTLEDEINSVTATRELNEILTSYEVEKKERALIESELAREKQQANIELLKREQVFEERIRLLMYVLMVALVIVLLLVFRSFRYRGKVNEILLTNNARIEKQHFQLSDLNEKLKKQAENDNLTGLKNRRYVTQLIAQTMLNQDALKNKWCVMMIDIDDFKQINDQYGHQRGDEILKQFAEILQKTANENDVVARWGGEEFLWLSILDGTSLAPEKCQQLHDNLAKTNWFREDSENVTCSIGFSTFPLVSLCFEDWEAALSLADHGLYQVKNTTKNSWYGFELVADDISYDNLSDIDGLVKARQLKTISKQ